MLIEFTSESTGNVLMFGKVATQLLKMMGQSGNSEGAIRAPDVPAALQKLNDALQAAPQIDQNQDDGDEDGESTVSIHTRAKPLVDLLEKSITQNSYVMWKPQ